MSVPTPLYVPRLLRDVLACQRARPLRSVLVVLALTVGMLALALLALVMHALSQRADALAQQLGADVFAVLSPADAGNGLTAADAELLAASLPRGEVAALREDRVRAPGIDGEIAVLAVPPAMFALRGWQAGQGRVLDVHDAAARARHIVISQALQRRTGWQVGQVSRLGEQSFAVVGVLRAVAAAPGSALLPAGAEFALLPDTLVPDWLSGHALDPGDARDAIFLRVAPGGDIAAAAARAERLLAHAARGRVFQVVTPGRLLEGVAQLRRSLYATAGVTTLLALLLGGVTLAGFLLAAVHERTVEIGLRRALGASARDIVALFVCEALLLVSCAAVAGLLLARQLAPAFGALVGETLRFGAAALWPLPLAAAALALLFAWWPARKAAAIEPAVALRAA